MPKRLVSIRISEAGKAKLDELTDRYQTKTTAIEIAIDRLYREESPMVTITSVNSRPELDPYRRDTGGATYTVLKIDPQARRAWVTQEYHSNSITADEWHHIILAWPLHTESEHSDSPDQDELSQLLHGSEGQALLSRICDGHNVEWDGHNMVGRLTDDAEEAGSALLARIDDLPASEWEIADAADWLYEIQDELREQLAAGRDIDDLAQEWEATARQDQVTLYGTTQYLTDLQQNLD